MLFAATAEIARYSANCTSAITKLLQKLEETKGTGLK
jgi:hypothetical protein